VRLIRALDPSDIRHRQQSGHEPHHHPVVGTHVLSSSRALPPSIHAVPGSHMSGASQYPSSQYDVKVEEDYMVNILIFFLVDYVLTWSSHRRRNRLIA
jgi:hypothetical protein